MAIKRKIRETDMKVLYIATSFPKPDNGSTIYTDLAEALVANGHYMTVVVAEEKKHTNKTYITKERRCEVLRVRTGNYYDVSFLKKGITFVTMEYIIKLAIKKHLKQNSYDVVLFESPPVTNAGIVKYAKKLFKAKSYLMLKDIFPQNAVDIGVIKNNSLIYKFFHLKEKSLYKHADIIGTMSQGNRNYVLKHNLEVNPEKVEIFPNTKKIVNRVKDITEYTIRYKYNIPLESTVFLFGGNMGKPQGTPLLCEAINQLKDRKDIFFLLIGRGTERENIRKYLEENQCKNALQIDNLPRNEYERVLRESDVGLVLLDHRFTIPNYPSRILAYMEYAKPVVVATDKHTDFKELIEKSNCGLWSYSENVNEFCKNIIYITEGKQLRKEMGNNGRVYMKKYFDVNRSVGILEKHFN